MVSRLHPVLRFWQIVLWPVARSTGKLLDRLVGREAIPGFRETPPQTVLRQHARSPGTEIGRLEARGAINFLSLDDLPVRKEGEPLDPVTVLRLLIRGGILVFPTFARMASDPFLGASGHPPSREAGGPC